MNKRQFPAAIRLAEYPAAFVIEALAEFSKLFSK